LPQRLIDLPTAGGFDLFDNSLKGFLKMISHPIPEKDIGMYMNIFY
jgi:hypothetical protein